MRKRRQNKLFYLLIILSLVLMIISIKGLFTRIDPSAQNLTFYNAKNLRRYNRYQGKHKDYDSETVVWHVNNNLDYPFFKKIIPIKKNEKLPLIVNKYYKLDDSFVPKDLVRLENHYMTKHTSKAFKKMRYNASLENMNLNIVVAYRSIDYQRQLYQEYCDNEGKESVDTYSARPGHSEHNTGRTIDISSANNDMLRFGDTQESKWIKKNAYKYGFIVRYQADTTHITGYQAEPWHITFVGKKIAKQMHNKKINTLEEYVARYRPDQLDEH